MLAKSCVMQAQGDIILTRGCCACTGWCFARTRLNYIIMHRAILCRSDSQTQLTQTQSLQKGLGRTQDQPICSRPTVVDRNKAWYFTCTGLAYTRRSPPPTKGLRAPSFNHCPAMCAQDTALRSQNTVLCVQDTPLRGHNAALRQQSTAMFAQGTALRTRIQPCM